MKPNYKDPRWLFDKRAGNLKALADTNALAKAPRGSVVSKRAAKRDSLSADKARSWRMRGNFTVPASRTKLSPISWA